ncbi:MAG: type II toxin-antitoxin system prevent-host-death family antitoxin [Bacillota bacterium]
MIIKATDMKNNFGKYLKLLDREDIIVTKNGTPVARLTKLDSWHDAGKVWEQSASYGYHGKKISYEEFMEMYEKTEERYEYIDGEVFLLASPKITHQRIIGNLFVIVSAWFKGKQCMPYLSPFDVILKKGENGMNVVQPDILVICDPENKNAKDRYTGIPSLVIEVLSETSSRMDLVKKLDLYMQTGIQEYWIVNYFSREVIVYMFKDKDVAAMRLFVKDDLLRSMLFDGLHIKLEEIFD